MPSFRTKKDCEEWIALSSQFPYLLERMKGVEPSCPAWEAGVLPMNYTRILICIDDTILSLNFPVFLITSSKENVSHDLPSFHVIF